MEAQYGCAGFYFLVLMYHWTQTRYIRQQAGVKGSFTGESGDAVQDAIERRQKGRKRVVSSHPKWYASTSA